MMNLPQNQTSTPDGAPAVSATLVVTADSLERIFGNLRAAGFTLIGPKVRDGAIVYDEVASPSDLPIGWTDEQDGGRYRLKKRDDQAVFGFVVGPHSWKQFLHVPALRLWQAKRNGNGFQVSDETLTAPKVAFLGVRSCEIHAISIQDKVFLQGAYVDTAYKARRENVFILAVNCGQAGGTCFCASMKTGSSATFGFDLALTEVLEDGRHYFWVEVGSEAGAAMLDGVSSTQATEVERAAADRVVAQAESQMGRSLETDGIKELLHRNYEHPRWDGRLRACGSSASRSKRSTPAGRALRLWKRRSGLWWIASAGGAYIAVCAMCANHMQRTHATERHICATRRN